MSSKTILEMSEDQMDFRDPAPDAALFAKGCARLPYALGQMGFSSLRPGGQDEIVMALLAGVDSICILPTSGGKSACFVIPALCHDWRLLIFSPLKALMVDQVRSLNDKGIPALAISSDNNDAVNRRNLGDWQDGACKIMFVAPERLGNDEFMQVMRQAPPDMVAIDETHTLSSWSDNFRHHYVHIGTFIEQFRPRLVAGFTATYSKEIDKDVRRVLRIPKAVVRAFYPRRSNLILSSSELVSDSTYQVAQWMRKISGPILMYCNSRKRTEEWAMRLTAELGETVGFYNAGVTTSVKREMQDAFFSGGMRIMVATNAFGMGIDKSDIRSVIHIDHPSDPESLSQEVGRAGRDGADSWCHTYSSQMAERQATSRIRDGNPTRGTIQQFFEYMTKRADRSNVVDIPARQVQKDLGISEYAYLPLIQLFLGSGILTEATDIPRISRLRFKDPYGCDSNAFAKLKEAMETIATPDPEFAGGYIFSPDRLCESLELSQATVTKNLKGWQSDGILVYDPPGRTQPKRIIGGLDQIDLDRMDAKRRLAFKKLEVVLEYFNVDDSEKHGYFEEYFTAFSK